MTPRDHKSTVWLYGCSRTSSGAMYNGVPVKHTMSKYMQTVEQILKVQAATLLQFRFQKQQNQF